MKYRSTFFLAFPEGADIILVRNSECMTEAKARLLLTDRKANGVAFLGEYVVKLQILG